MKKKTYKPEVFVTFLLLKAAEIFIIMLGFVLLSRFGLWFEKIAVNEFGGEIFGGFWIGVGYGIVGILCVIISLAIVVGTLWLLSGMLLPLFKLNWKWAEKIVKESNKKK